MLSNKIKLKTDTIVKDDFIALSKSLDSQKELLYEDMFQAAVKLNNNSYVFDVGWYGDFENGKFICFLIKDYDWDNPVKKASTRNPREVVSILDSFEEYLKLE